MGYMILEFTFKDNAFAEISGPDIKFWLGQGLPDYEGGLDGFAEVFPTYMAQLIAKKAVKKHT